MSKIITDASQMKAIPQEPLEQILKQIDCSKMTMDKIVFHVYESTYLRYHLKFHEEMNLRVKYENKIVDQVGSIAKRDALIDELIIHIDDNLPGLNPFKKAKDGL